MIIKWTHEVDEVLCMESQKELEEGRNPCPETEITFWERRSSNLESLHDQLTSPTVKCLVNILVLTKSGYYALFRSIGRIGTKFKT